ncbi:trimeric intracellular cation channel family protein [Erwinia sorbitola]|uniref:Trimeric intracellular cation channel family protein n=1 Tax=Erwinia sorbitola TaxID=2681984 RepID=A0A6I6EB51_9GAMM|nr:trimeric intracellular cation channel family protein [Erwinia sorbitola]MTD26460.1 trimeric intracellular cation channel family protein [Erwinia sorbitola]QGU86964.1 trimeric intracellular cation channel family protein [Erwinia sorbitola]
MLNVFHIVDLVGTLAFALSGATAGVREDYDIFGVFVLTAATAVGGGVIRDICIASLPPAGLVSSAYLLIIIAAMICVAFFQRLILSFEKATLFFDALGLGFFAAYGANKTWEHTQNIELSLLLGCISAVGGGSLRDLLTGKPPAIFSQDIYASAALVGAAIQLTGSAGIIPQFWSAWCAIIGCTLLRLISLRYKIGLPSIKHNGL